MSFRCPVCGSTDVRKQTTSLARPEGSPFATRSLVELYCFNCRTLEDRRDDAADYATWMKRWQATDRP